MQAATDSRAAYFRVLVLASAVLVLSTFVFRFRSAYFLFLAPLNLTEENVFAAWFSGMLLLLASLHAADGYSRLRQTNMKAAIAWCVISAMLLALSLDEIGCLHERIELLKTGPVLSFVPFLLVLLGGCAWSFVQLWLTPSERPKVGKLILGFAILVSVGGQEILERILQLPWYIRPFRSAFEEGSELAAMLILIYTTLPNSTGLFSASRPPRDPAFSTLFNMRWLVAAAAAAIAWPLAAFTSSLEFQAPLGHLSDWMSCALFFLSAALLVHAWIQSPDWKGFPAAGVSLLCVASVLCVQIDPIGDTNVFPASTTIGLFGFELNTRLVLLALCCAGAAESLRIQRNRAGTALMVAVGVMSACFATFSTADTLWWGYFATTVVALATFTTLSLMLRRETPVPQAALA